MEPDRRPVRRGATIKAFLFDRARGYPCAVTALDERGCNVRLTRIVTLSEIVELQLVGSTQARRAYVRSHAGVDVRLSFNPPGDVVEL